LRGKKKREGAEAGVFCKNRTGLQQNTKLPFNATEQKRKDTKRKKKHANVFYVPASID